jgi:hypothetical protein
MRYVLDISAASIIHPYEPLLRRAVNISSQTRSGLFDCLYEALAEREGCEVVTDDPKLIANLETAAQRSKLLRSNGQPCGSEERSNQVRLLPQASDSQVEFQMQLFQVHARTVAHFHMF